MIKSKFKFLVFAAALAFVGMGKNAVHAATYSVKSGDTLYSISRNYGTNYNYLMSANKLQTSAIYAGQSLKVPDVKYTIKSGDTLYSIAKRFGVLLSDLQLANNISNNIIKVGQVIVIPVNASTASTPSYVISCTSSEVDLLARLINAEAGGESYNAMVSVGAVIVNRVQSSAFPNTVTGVIYQVSNGYYQFTPVLNGMINKGATASSLSAAKAALYGSDPTKGALYFYDNTVSNTWLTSKPVSLVSGKLIFAY
ncbi:lytic transglycosylase [Clostridium acetobutylicum]|nr:lytic transglycosylase [Clostridium acetobutylicum]